MKKNIVVRHPKQLTRHWAQQVLRHSELDALVKDVVIESVDPGTTTRIALAVHHDAGAELPRQWFIKLPSLMLKARLITLIPQLLQKEIYFYNSLQHIAPLQMPQILAAQTRFGYGSTLVMANLQAVGQRPGQTSDALSLAQAQAVITELAKLHVFFYANPELLKQFAWLSNFNAKAEVELGSLLALPLMRRGLRLAGELTPASLHEPALYYAANRQRIMQMLAANPQTLIHHDCHPGNLFWTEAGPGFLDWQLVRLGEGVSDVAYFLATALTVEDRRRYEMELLRLYFDLLAESTNLLSEQHFYQRYRMHLSYAFEAMIVTLAIGGMMELASNLALIQRASAAVIDHASFAALGYAKK